MDSPSPVRRVHYVLSSHWDREWYQSFQDYRYRLVELLDHVLDGLTTGRLQGPFTTDGQAIMLDDYLEIRPEKRALVEQLVQTGRLVVGPWYVLPDEFLVSGESLIRNLRLGRATARAYGGLPSAAGFVCDLFGHIGQIPQLLAGFGATGAFVWRGINTIETRFLNWASPDGTTLPCYRFGLQGYCSFAVLVRRASDFYRDESFDAAAFDDRLDAFLKSELARMPAGMPIILFDGGDHQGWDEPAYRAVIDYFARHTDQYEWIHSTLDGYIAEMAKHADKITLTHTGEMREPARWPSASDSQWLIPGVGSSRVNIKIENAECENLLCQRAEPISAMAAVLAGRTYPASYLDVAWRWLLQNHPHDSIGGCSIDVVHEDMRYRFSQCRQIGNRVVGEAMMHIGRHIEGDLAQDELRIVLFNPHPWPVDEVVDATLDVPDCAVHYQSHNAVEDELIFHLYDASGNKVPVQRLKQKRNQQRFDTHPVRMPAGYKVHEATVAFEASVPAMGYAAYTVRLGNEEQVERVAMGPSLLTSDRTMENEHLRVTVESNGSLTLLDKQTGEIYRRLLTFEDSADCGDGWNHGPIIGDEVFTSSASSSQVSVVASGAMRCTLRIRTTLRIPARLTADPERWRSDDLIDLPIDSRVTLRKDARRVEVAVTVDNRARNHRLRVLFPTDVAGDTTYLSDAAFDVVERPIALRADNHLFREPEVEAKPQQTWTAIADGQRGLAVVANGLLEAGVRDHVDRPILLTLFRATGATVFTSGEPLGQLIGQMTFKFYIVPQRGEIDRAGLLRAGQALGTGWPAVQIRAWQLYRRQPNLPLLPTTAGWLQLTGELVMTSCLQIDGQMEIRLFNPHTHTAQGELACPGWETLNAAVLEVVNLESQAAGVSVPIIGKTAVVLLKPKQIVTLRLPNATCKILPPAT